MLDEFHDYNLSLNTVRQSCVACFLGSLVLAIVFLPGGRRQRLRNDLDCGKLASIDILRKPYST